MTGWEVERTMRTACRSESIPAGGSSLMPSHSQGAERRPERRAGNTGSRWTLRALVIGGLAGAAWLLTGTAANAADHDVEPVGSVFGSTVEIASYAGDETLVSDLLKAAAQPLESGPEVHRQVVTSILATPDRVLSEPVAMLDEVGLGEVVRDGSAIDAETLGTEPWTSTVPPRTSGAEQDDRTRPEPAEDAADPVTEPVTEPVPADLPPVVEPVVAQPVTSAVTTTRPVAGRPVAAERVRVATRTTPPASAGDSTRAHRSPDGVTPVRHGKAKFRSPGHRKISHRHVPAVEPAAPETVREEAPGDDRRAPMRMNLGAVSGIPASGPGASPEYGSTAVLPARIANGVVDDHRFPPASDVDVRRHDAEAPTVSPD